MKFAVIKAGGKQYIVKEGQEITVEKLGVADGEMVSLPVLATFTEDGGLELGTPELKTGAVVKVSGTMKDKKITVIKYKNKTRYARKVGHRQTVSKAVVDKI